MRKKAIIELPTLAIDLQCYENEYIRLTITEIFGFPNEIAYGGGYGAKGSLDIQVGPYNVRANHYFTTGELYDFYCQLQKSYDSLNGESILSNTEQELELKLVFNKTGKILVTGEFQARLDILNKLYFEMTTDQTYISKVLINLRKIYQVFGDARGIT